MPELDADFIQRLRATFKVEAEDHLQTMSKTLVELEKPEPSGSVEASIEAVYREAHSLKGAARSVDLSDIEALCQALESVLAVCKRERRTPSPDAFDVFHQVLDLIRALLASPGALSENISNRRDQLITQLTKLVPSQSDSGARAEVSIAPTPALAPAVVRPVVRPTAEMDRVSGVETVRIPVAKLDSHLLHTEGLLTVKAMLGQRVVDLREACSHFERWQGEWSKVADEVGTFVQANTREAKAVGHGSPAAICATLDAFLAWHHDYARSLETKLIALTEQAAQDRHAVSRRVDDLLEDSKKLLMLPFSTISDVFPKLVRDLCRDQGKEANLVVRGEGVEVDKRILEEMKDALIHILRNCVDHGLEKPVERMRLKKSSRGVISVAISPVNGSKVEIEVSDDGAGVNLGRVKESAVRQGILTVDEAAGLADSAALPLIFRSEVTTSPTVTQFSGRGLGMAIVRAKAELLGGQVSVESHPNKGTKLRILLPLTLATFRGVFIDVAGHLFVVPTSNVERVLRIKLEDIHTVENREVISYQGQTLSLARLSGVLGLPLKQGPAVQATAVPVIVVYAAGQRVAFAVSEILHETEVLVKPLGKPLVRVRNISGATVLGSGKVVPVLSIGDLMKSARHHGAPPENAMAIEKSRRQPAKRVLVVEDSITSRMLLKGVLESAGHLVKTAVDGVDALTILREGSFDLVVSDVEMPRMNGFDLTARIRMDRHLKELPVILVTALESREERERGIDVGASAYIMKSTFDRNNLLDVIRGLV